LLALLMQPVSRNRATTDFQAMIHAAARILRGEGDRPRPFR
jgi:hypothetical protein